MFLKLMPFLTVFTLKGVDKEECGEFGFLCRQGKKERKGKGRVTGKN